MKQIAFILIFVAVCAFAYYEKQQAKDAQDTLAAGKDQLSQLQDQLVQEKQNLSEAMIREHALDSRLSLLQQERTQMEDSLTAEQADHAKVLIALQAARLAAKQP